MKKLVSILIVISVLCIGCTGQSRQQQVNQNGADEAAKEKVLNMAVFWFDSNLEPTEGWNGWGLTRCGIGENLIQLDENLEFKPVIAASYEQVDELTTIFQIRENVTFHNGHVVDAKACKASIERALEISDRDDVKFPVESITAEGQTLTIKTTKPYATLINNLADPVFVIVDASVADDEQFKFKPVTTGAFKVETFTPSVGMTLHKHTSHWSGDIGVDVVNVKYIQDASTRTMTLQSGEIDLATQVSPKDLALFENDDHYVVQKGPNLRVFLLRINMDKPYMKHLAFRQALCYGIDKATYASQIVKGIPAKGPFNDMLPFHVKEDDAYPYNPEKAKELLDQLNMVDTDGDGIREMNGENIVLTYISRSNHGNDANNIGMAMQSQYREIGLGVDIVQVENYADIASSGEYDLLWERWTSAPTADPQYFLEASYKTDSSGNYGHYSNQNLDKVCLALDKELNKDSRYRLGAEGAKILMDDVASIFLYYQEGTIVTNKNVGGVYRFLSEVYYIDDRVTME